MIVRATDWLSRVLLVIAAVLGFLLAFVVCADVIGRVVFNSPLKGTPEMVSISIVIICFLQAGYAIRSGGMIHVDFVVSRLPPRVQSYLVALGAVFGAAFFGLVCWGSIDPAIHAWISNEFEGEGALRVPSWPARFVVTLGTGLATLSYVLLAIESLRAGLNGRGPAVHTDAPTLT